MKDTGFTISGVGFTFDPSGPITDENGAVIGMASNWRQGAIDVVFRGVTGPELFIQRFLATEDLDGKKEFKAKILSRAQWIALPMDERYRCLCCFDDVSSFGVEMGIPADPLVALRDKPCDKCLAHEVIYDTAVCHRCGYDHVTGRYVEVRR